MNTATEQAIGVGNELNEVVLEWWASVDKSAQDQTIYLSRKEDGQYSLLDRFTIDPETMPTEEDFQFAVKELYGGGVYEGVIRRSGGVIAHCRALAPATTRRL